MNLRCPQCLNPIEVVGETLDFSFTCPACGSQLDLMGELETIDQGASRTVGHFQLLEHIGSGHFGDVWMARDHSLDRLVAVKIPRVRELDRRTLAVFLREARAAAQLRHPNIVPVHEVGREEDLVYIVSEYVAGVTLSEDLSRRQRSSLEQAQLCATIAEALHHAHEAGIVHRDLKPGNVMIDGAGQPHLMDFGLAKRDAGEVTVTVQGKILGTPAYMSPEQARGDAHAADRRSDIYSLGVILYELLAGRRPFQGGSRLLIHQVLHDEPRPPRGLNKAVPRDLEVICLKAMSKEPARRYATAEAMADDLRRFIRGEPILARRAGYWERGRKLARKHLAATAAGSALVAMLLFIAILVRDRGSLSAALSAAAPGPRTVALDTDPPGARGVLTPIDRVTGLPDASRRIPLPGKTPVEVQAPAGVYLVVVDLPGFGFHEVYRTAPASDDELAGAHLHQNWTLVDGKVTWPTIKIHRTAEVRREMSGFAGGSFEAGGDDVPARPLHSRYVDPYWLDVTEVTVGRYREVLGYLPPGLENRQEPFEDDDAMASVSFNQALVFAERAGKRLPSEYEYEFAATNQGTTKFPWGDDAGKLLPWRYGRVKATAPFDVTQLGTKPVFGLFSNVAEWVDSTYASAPLKSDDGLQRADPPAYDAVLRTIRGGSSKIVNGAPSKEEINTGPRRRYPGEIHAHQPTLGFRCAQSEKPRFLD